MMTKTMLILFWILWLLDVLAALLGYREFIMGIFGRYAAPTSRYIMLWVVLLGIMLMIIMGSLYFKNLGRNSVAMSVVAIPLVFALPYILFLAAMVIGGSKTNWH